MSRVLFNTSCLACGRKLLAKIKDLGGEMRCPHCRGRFIARDSDNLVEDRSSILQRLKATLQCTASLGSELLS